MSIAENPSAALALMHQGEEPDAFQDGMPAQLQTCLTRALEVAHAERGAIYLLSSTDRQLHRVLALGSPEASAPRVHPLPAGTARARAPAHRRPVLRRSIASAEALFPRVLAPTDEPRGRWLTIPLQCAEEVLGTVCLAPTGSPPLPEWKMGSLSALAAQLSAALRKCRLAKVIEESRAELQRREAETQRLRYLTEQLLFSMPGGIAVLGGNLKIFAASRVFWEMLGVTAEGVEGKLLPEVATLDGVQDLLAAALTSPSPPVKREAIYHHPDLGRRWYVLSASRLKPPGPGDGEEDGAVLLALDDVTEWKQTQESLQETSRLISVGEIVAGVAHELNNPLASVLGFAQLLLEQEPPEAIRGDLELICTEAQRAATVVHNLLGFVRKRKAEQTWLHVPSVVDRVLTLKSYDLRVSNTQVETSFPPDPPRVLADEHQLEQVFLNIVTNAEQAMSEAHQGGRLLIDVARNGKKLVVAFRDDGPGILPRELKLIFEPFFTTKEKGTGLGLSICKSLVQQQGGRIWVESQEGKGATFYVELPIPEASGSAG
ncbi:MAG: GAF domain-containing protein [Chloroflexi bacterium]|nr:GAF domain-containing protein [Chloroflexota bacterium]